MDYYEYLFLITALTPMYKEAIIFEMLKLGYTMRSANKDFISIDSEVSCVIGFIASYKSNKDKDLEGVFEDLKNVLKNIDAKYYSLIVKNGSGGIRWTGANFTLPQDDENEI